MKRTNKKGFTIVELVVVIAVIAILAAVLIPTFSGVTGKAKDAALKADLKAAYTQYLSDKTAADGDAADVVYIKYNSDYYMVANGDTQNATKADLPECVDEFVGGKVFEKLADACADTDEPADGICNTCGKEIE